MMTECFMFCHYHPSVEVAGQKLLWKEEKSTGWLMH